MKPLERPLLAALGISMALLTIVIISPLSTDDLVWHSITLDLYRFGKIPYLGSWDQNFPGIMLIHYLAIIIFGEQDLALRFLDVIIQLGFAMLFYKFCRIWLREQTAAIAVVLYVFYYVSGRGSLYTERDVYGIMAIIASLYFVLQSARKPGHGQNGNTKPMQYMIAGLFGGYSIIIRPTFGLACVLIAAFILSAQDRSLRRVQRWMPVLLYTCACALPMMALLLFYFSIPGGMKAFYLATIRFNLDVYSSLHGALPILIVWIVFFWRGLLLPLALLGWMALRWHSNSKASSTTPASRQPGTLCIHRSWTRSERLLYASLLLSFLLIAMIQPNYLAYHFAPFYLLLCPFSAIGVVWTMHYVRGWFLRTCVIAIVGSLYLFFMVGDRREIGGFVQALFDGGNPFEAAYAHHHSSASFGAVPEREVLHYLALPGNDTGSVEVCSFEPLLRAHLNRAFAGRYVLPTAIALGTKRGTLSKPDYTDYQIVWREHYMDSLRSERPIFIIIARNTDYWYLHDPYQTYLHTLPGFDSLLQASYRYDTAFGCYQIFRRNH